MDTGHLLDDASDDEVQGLVNDWRKANPHTVNLWYDVENAALDVISYGGTRQVRSLTFAREYDIMQGTPVMTIRLPSGRKLYYINPQITENRWGQPSLSYYGVDQTPKKWKPIETYGGKLTENCVQAIARDCLAEAIERLEAAGFPIVFHVHDEVVIDIAPFADEKAMLKKVTDIMTIPIPWAQGLPLGADGWVGTFFKKD